VWAVGRMAPSRLGNTEYPCDPRRIYWAEAAAGVGAPDNGHARYLPQDWRRRLPGCELTLTADMTVHTRDAHSSGYKKLSLRVNFSWVLVGNVVYGASQWGVLVVFAKLGEAAIIGRYALASAVSGPIIIFFQLQLRALQVTDTKDEYVFRQYLGLRLFAMCLAVGIATTIGFLAYPASMGLLILLVSISQATTACRDVFLGAMQKYERMDYVGIGQMIAGPLTLVGLTTAFIHTNSLCAAVAVAILIKLFMLLLYDASRVSRLLKALADSPPQARMMRPSFTVGPMWRLTRLAIPLGLVMMLASAGTNMPRYFLEALRGEAALGYFAAIAALLQIGVMVVGALGQSASPRLARYYQDNLAAFRWLVIKLSVVGLALGASGIVIAVFFGRPILALLFSAEYSEYNEVLVLLMVVGGVSYIGSFLGYAMTAARYLKVQVPILSVFLAAALIGSWMLIGPFGLQGAVIALLGAEVIRLAMEAAVVIHGVRKQVKIRASA